MRSENFRIAKRNDAVEIAKLVNAAYRPKMEEKGWTHEAHLVSGERTSHAQVIELINKPNSSIIIAHHHDEIIGCVHVEKDENASHIGMLAIKPTLQTQGIGKKLLAAAENYAVKYYAAEKLILTVISDRDTLIAYYLRRGYFKTGIVMNYPILAGVGSPKKAMLKIEIMEKTAIKTE